MGEGEWTVITSRRQTGSPGSGEWVDYLCFRRRGFGYELSICGFEWDAEGNETDNFIADPSVNPVDIVGVGEPQIIAALEDLNWTVADADRVAAALAVAKR